MRRNNVRRFLVVRSEFSSGRFEQTKNREVKDKDGALMLFAQLVAKTSEMTISPATSLFMTLRKDIRDV